MKLVKSLLLGSAAGLSAVAGAQAADLPVKKAAPVEYVRVCSAYGAGFFYIPGTDTCLRVSGRARLDVGYIQSFGRVGTNGDLSAFRALGRLNVDARTQTGYGTLRTFIRYDIASASGNYLTSGTATRNAKAYTALSVDNFARLQTQVILDKAFIQFAGLTAGRASSFFDFYAHDFEIIGSTLGSDQSATNLLAYTATFGQGFSATISMEDPSFRRQPLFGNAATAGNVASQFNLFLNNANVSPVLAVGPGGAPALAFEDVVQRERLPDFVGALRYDAPWGSAQISAAVHEISVGQASFVTNLAGATAAGFVASTVAAPRPQNEYGWAIQGGLKINTPFIAAGDALYLQGAYGEGAQTYTGYSAYTGTYTANAVPIQGGEFSQYLADAVLNPVTGRLELSNSFTVVGSYLHYWSPEFRSAFFGSYGEMRFPTAARNAVANLGFNFGGGTALGTPVSAANRTFNPTLRDNNQLVAGASLIWSPVRDLDIGLEGLYTRVAVNQGRVVDVNKQPGAFVTSVNAAGQPIGTVGGLANQPIRTVTSEDTFQLRFRVQRDF